MTSGCRDTMLLTVTTGLPHRRRTFNKPKIGMSHCVPPAETGEQKSVCVCVFGGVRTESLPLLPRRLPPTRRAVS